MKVSEVNEANNKRILPFSIAVTSLSVVFDLVKETEQSIVLIYRPRDLMCQSTQKQRKPSSCIPRENDSPESFPLTALRNCSTHVNSCLD